MVVFIGLLAWYLVGVITLAVWWRQELDVMLSDFILILLGGVAGPISLVLPLLSWVEKKEIVVFKRKSK